MPNRPQFRKRPANKITIANTCISEKQVKNSNSLDRVAFQALKEARLLSDIDQIRGIEYGGFILKKDGEYVAVPPEKGSKGAIPACTMANKLLMEGFGKLEVTDPNMMKGYSVWKGMICPYRRSNGMKVRLFLPTNTKVVATYHIHPPTPWTSNSFLWNFSPSDFAMAYEFNIKMYMLTPECTLRLYIPDIKKKKPNPDALVISPHSISLQIDTISLTGQKCK